MTVTVRRTIVGLLTLVGGYYAFVGASALLTLGQVTRRWIQLSGDPDFPADAGQFGILIGAGAAIWLGLGIGTALCGVRTLTGDQVSRASWIGLTTIAVVVHVPWMLYKIIGTGALPRPEAMLQIRAAGLQFASVALLYIAGLLATRRWSAAHDPAVNRRCAIEPRSAGHFHVSPLELGNRRAGSETPECHPACHSLCGRAGRILDS